MSWLFSRALVEACSPPNSLGTEQSAQLSVMPTPHLFWRNDKTMDFSRLSRFGLTYAVLTEDRGAELLTAWLAGFHARTSAPQEKASVSMANVPASGASLPASFARWSPQSFGWKTAQCSLLEDSQECLETLPRWGSMRSGMLYLRQTLAPGISVTGFGSLLPTLTVCGNYNAKGASATSGDGLATVLKRDLLPTLLVPNGGRIVKHCEFKGNTAYHQGKKVQVDLRAALTRMPTLVARDYRHPGRSRLERTGSKAGEHLPNSVGGPLNPDWCEWFMGFPIGWTESKPLAMPKFQEWRQQHSPHSKPIWTKEAA